MQKPNDAAGKLEAFVKGYKPTRHGPTCGVCALPAEHLKAITDRYLKLGTANGGYPLMARFLKAEGFDVRYQNIGRHFREGHHER